MWPDRLTFMFKNASCNTADASKSICGVFYRKEYKLEVGRPLYVDIHYNVSLQHDKSPKAWSNTEYINNLSRSCIGSLHNFFISAHRDYLSEDDQILTLRGAKRIYILVSSPALYSFLGKEKRRYRMGTSLRIYHCSLFRDGNSEALLKTPHVHGASMYTSVVPLVLSVYTLTGVAYRIILGYWVASP